jgi:hypothetical protein
MTSVRQRRICWHGAWVSSVRTLAIASQPVDPSGAVARRLQEILLRPQIAHGPQQVNNGEPSRAGNLETGKIELLEAHGETGGPRRGGHSRRRRSGVGDRGNTRPARERLKARPDQRGMPTEAATGAGSAVPHTLLSSIHVVVVESFDAFSLDLHSHAWRSDRIAPEARGRSLEWP